MFVFSFLGGIEKMYKVMRNWTKTNIWKDLQKEFLSMWKVKK